MTDTVDSGIASVSAISAAVMRNLRSDTITATRSGGVRLATRCGADERSARPATPASRYLPTHLRAQRTLTPAAAAAALIVHPSSSTRRANNRLPVQLRAALRWSLIRVASLDLVAWQLPASNAARMNQPA
jgi:hypothetical protein